MAATITPLAVTGSNMTDDSPTLRSKALGAELRKIRDRRGETLGRVVTLGEVETALDRSSGWLSRIENGRRKLPAVSDVRALLDYYEVTDETVREQLLSITKQARTRGWWNTFKDEIPEAYATYVGFEAGARKIYIASSSIVPGLLQTADYAREVIGAAGVSRGLTAQQIDARVAVRARRQQLLTREDNPVALRAVIDEAALLRRVGSAKVMREQLDYLISLTDRPNVALQVVPFSAGAHAAATADFTILEFPGTGGDIVSIETLVGSLFIEKSEEVDPHIEAFRDLHSVALSEADSLHTLAQAKADY